MHWSGAYGGVPSVIYKLSIKILVLQPWSKCRQAQLLCAFHLPCAFFLTAPPCPELQLTSLRSLAETKEGEGRLPRSKDSWVNKQEINFKRASINPVRNPRLQIVLFPFDARRVHVVWPRPQGQGWIRREETYGSAWASCQNASRKSAGWSENSGCWKTCVNWKSEKGKTALRIVN